MRWSLASSSVSHNPIALARKGSRQIRLRLLVTYPQLSKAVRLPRKRKLFLHDTCLTARPAHLRSLARDAGANQRPRGTSASREALQGYQPQRGKRRPAQACRVGRASCSVKKKAVRCCGLRQGSPSVAWRKAASETSTLARITTYRSKTRPARARSAYRADSVAGCAVQSSRPTPEGCGGYGHLSMNGACDKHSTSSMGSGYRLARVVGQVIPRHLP